MTAPYALVGDQQLATLAGMADGVLRRLVSVARTAGVDLPTRQIIYPTTVPLDCAQVAVVFNGWQAEPQGDGMIQCFNARWAARIGVGITRPTPAMPSKGGQPPAAASMSAAAKVASDDAELLLQLLQVLPEFGADVLIETGPPEGAFQTVTLSVVVTAFADGT
jgi:hypothetical protein